MTFGSAVRAPLLHFLLLGALLYVLKPFLPLSSDSNWQLQTITVSEAELQRLYNTWRMETGRVPSEAEQRAGIQRHIDDEILLREALKLGLHQADSVARGRLIANMRFAFPESTLDDTALLAEALTLGMQERDLVVRRRLVQLMQMRIVSGANISEGQLREFIAQHPARYGQPVRFAFRHVFFSADHPVDEITQMANVALKQLQGGGTTGVTGDPFLLGSQFSLRSETDIARQFGPDFARSLTQLAPGAWAGPLHSPFGLHLVKVEQIESAAEPDFERVSARAAYALLSERERQVLQDELTRLRLRYRVESPEQQTLPAVPAGQGS